MHLFILTLLLSFSVLGFSEELAHQLKSVTAMDETLHFYEPFSVVNDYSLRELQFSSVASALTFQHRPSDLGANLPSNDFSNVHVIGQKNHGPIQFYIQAGTYAMPTLGANFERSIKNTRNTYGFVPHAYISIVPDSHWNISLGKLLSMPGYENPFTFQNQNIQRGILENQNNTICRGAQINYSNANSSAFFTVNDGFSSGDYTWIGAGVSYKFNDFHSTNIMLGGAIKTSSVATSSTPLLQNNSQIYNVVHAIKLGSWSITPYIQYTVIPNNGITNLGQSASTLGYAGMINYRVNSLGNSNFIPNATINLPLRLERIKASDYNYSHTQYLVYGPNSSAFALTFTPTYQSGSYFARGEFSWVKASHYQEGLVFSANGNTARQTRVLFELGVLY